MLKLYKHQEKFKQNMTDNMLLVWEGGSGKTIGACLWLKDGRDADALVICPKRVVKKWEAELEKWGTKATVVSKENFKKMKHKEWSAKVVDEADDFASPLFTKQRSQLSTHMFNLTMQYPDMPTLLLTATPIRSNPYNLHTLLWFKGTRIDWKKWRAKFFSLETKPYLKYPTWLPREGWQKMIQPYLEKASDIVLLKDCVGELPPIEEEIVKVKPKGKFVKDIDWVEPKKIFVEKHKHEQNDKVKHIVEKSKGFRKVIVVAYYRSEVDRLGEALSKYRKTYAVHGGTKDQEEQLLEANSPDVGECFLVVQASLGVGWDGDTFSQVVFTSMSYAVRDYSQIKFRVRRIHNLQPVKYLFLMGGKCDNAVYKTIMKGKDFVPSEYLDETTRD
jgi:superfamily II DNA or RNA helicase